ncbi:hypothetical protein BC936DRAFT_144420 [Jimgerdemannia flammicorona]|uniref:Uncharacterized protein n=1 Tax=Jimgerdemannia flammicorona TaxID=994334 RepID=A0A433DCK0_9FUNG|nr:hypothetical protein BC936DRAFT_144420 [Jimgerdemannia flammicorona]
MLFTLHIFQGCGSVRRPTTTRRSKHTWSSWSGYGNDNPGGSFTTGNAYLMCSSRHRPPLRATRNPRTHGMQLKPGSRWIINTTCGTRSVIVLHIFPTRSGKTLLSRFRTLFLRQNTDSPFAYSSNNLSPASLSCSSHRRKSRTCSTATIHASRRPQVHRPRRWWRRRRPATNAVAWPRFLLRRRRVAWCASVVLRWRGVCARSMRIWWVPR